MFHNKHSYLITYCDIKVMIQTFIRINIYKPGKTMPPPILQQWRKNRKAHKVCHVFNNRRRRSAQRFSLKRGHHSVNYLLTHSRKIGRKNNWPQQAAQYIYKTVKIIKFQTFFLCFLQSSTALGTPTVAFFSSKLQFVVHNKQYTPLLRPLNAAKEIIS